MRFTHETIRRRSKLSHDFFLTCDDVLEHHTHLCLLGPTNENYCSDKIMYRLCITLRTAEGIKRARREELL